MISRRENLLIRPWEQRRYENHRKKVLSAGPAIDSKPPVSRQHVMVKLKKKQKEVERCNEIEKNNFILLKKMNHIMRTSRVDNYWKTPQPNFLNRIAKFEVYTPTLEEIFFDDLPFSEEREETDEQPIRKSKCYACTPQELPQPKIPEERIPWEPEKPPISRKRSKSVPVRKPNVTREQTLSGSISTKKPREKSVTFDDKTTKKTTESKKTEKTKLKFVPKSPQNLYLSRGGLNLNVNFPADTFVKFQVGKQERVLMHGSCKCKNPAIMV